LYHPVYSSARQSQTNLGTKRNDIKEKVSERIWETVKKGCGPKLRKSQQLEAVYRVLSVGGCDQVPYMDALSNLSEEPKG
jgi:hypothetical protein